MKPFVSPHVHQQSIDSASSPDDFIARELELGTGYTTVTDHGYMGACRTVYDLALKNKLKPILGVEGYFFDPDDSTLAKFGIAGKEALKEYVGNYYHITLHFRTQKAYELACKLLTRADDRAITVWGERKPPFTWADLEALGQEDTTCGSGCFGGMVQDHIASHGRADIAQAYYERLRSTFKPGNFFAEVFPHRLTHEWDDGVHLTFSDGSTRKYRASKKLRVDTGTETVEIHADKLAKTQTFGVLVAVMDNRVWVVETNPQTIVKAEANSGFVPNECSPLRPNGDLQWAANRFVLAMANKYGDPVLASDDCVAAGTLIRTEQGYRPIENIIPGDLVISHTGKLCTVEATRGILSSDVVTIDTRYGSLSATSRHRVLAKRGGGVYASGTYCRSLSEIAKDEAQWVEAGSLFPGDLLFLPKPATTLRTDVVSKDLAKNLHHNMKCVVLDDKITVRDNVHGQTISFSRFLPVSENTCRVLGLFLGDGCATYNNHVSWGIDNSAATVVGEWLRQFAMDMRVKLEVKIGKTMTTYRLVSSPINAFFRTFYDEHGSKILPAWVKALPFSKTSNILSGLYWSDGFTRIGNGFALTMSSLNVVSWAREELLSMGVFCGWQQPILKTGSKKKLYTFTTNSNVASVVPFLDFERKELLKAHTVEEAGGWWFRVQDVSHAKELTPVYDLQVSGDNSFCTVTAAVHNCHFATPQKKVVQDIRLSSYGRVWKFYGSYHRQSSEEAYEYFKRDLGMNEAGFEKLVENSYQFASLFNDFKFVDRKQLPTKFYPEDTLRHLKSLIDYHGRMDWNNPEYVKRLKQEIELLKYNGTIDLLPYFFVAEGAPRYYEEELHKLTGPGRGSAAGVLLTYLLGITHADPIQYGLSLDRFLTVDRIQSGKLPDIDQDLPERDSLMDPANGWLQKQFPGHWAQISTDNCFKLKSAVKDVCRVMHNGRVPKDVEELTKDFQVAPQGIEDYDFIFGFWKNDEEFVQGSIETDANLKKFIASYPREWEVVQSTLGLTKSKGRHACLPAGDLILVVDGNELVYKGIEQCDGATVLTGEKKRVATAKLLPKGPREVIEYSLDNGKKIRATATHPVLTSRGWMPIQLAMDTNAELLSANLEEDGPQVSIE